MHESRAHFMQITRLRHKITRIFLTQKHLFIVKHKIAGKKRQGFLRVTAQNKMVSLFVDGARV